MIFYDRNTQQKVDDAFICNSFEFSHWLNVPTGGQISLKT